MLCLTEVFVGEFHWSNESGVPPLKNGRQVISNNAALPTVYDPIPGSYEVATLACFAVLYRDNYGDCHVHHAGWFATDVAAEQQKLRLHVR